MEDQLPKIRRRTLWQLGPGAVAATRRAASACPNEAIESRWTSLCAVRCLNRAWSFQRNSGCCCASSKVRGSRPRYRASAKLKSARAETDASASSLHQRGQAALIAEALSPTRARRRRTHGSSLVSTRVFSLGRRSKPLRRIDDLRYGGGVRFRAIPNPAEGIEDLVSAGIGS